MKIKHGKKGQGTLEYAIIIVVVIGALIAMQWYIKGAYQGKLRQSSDDMGEQFSPIKTAGTYTTFTNTSTNEASSGGSLNGSAMPTTTSNYSQNQSRNVSENVQGLGEANYQR